MQGEEDVAQLVADFSGSDRHVAGYLLEEVLNRQPEGRQRFLLETAVLERFDAVVCNHLTGRDDSHQMLKILDQNNLFIIPLDNQGKWYRYHHLFAQLLRHRLEQNETAESRAARHRRARDWFDAQGLMEETIYHSLKAGDKGWVADYLCRIEPANLWEGTMAAMFKSWLIQLPDELFNRSHRLLLLASWAYLITADIEEMEKFLTPLTKMPDLADTLQAELFLIQAIFARGQGQNEKALELVSKALAVLPEAQETMRHIAFMQVVSACINLGQIDRAYDVSRFVYDSVDTHTTTGLNMFLTAAQMMSVVLRDKAKPYPAMNMLQHTIEIVNERAKTSVPMIGVLYIEIGRIYYEWNELEKAVEFCDKTIALGERTGISDLLFPSYLLDASLARLEGDYRRIEERLKWFREVTHQANMTEMVTISEFLEAAFRLDIGDLDSAVRWINASGLKLTDEPTYHRYGHYHTLIRIYLAECGRSQNGQQQLILLSQLAELLERLLIVVREVNVDYGLIELMVLKAVLLNMQGNLTAAADILAKAISLAEFGTLVRVFLDGGPAIYPIIREVALNNPDSLPGNHLFIQRLLRACEAEWGRLNSGQFQLFTSPLIDPLTDREREVLTCIVAGLSNREIEERLHITHTTVRTHIKNLYSKLGVNGRKEAVEQGQFLGLV
jgi:LuxR family maltose regulon positive regulatory protein